MKLALGCIGSAFALIACGFWLYLLHWLLTTSGAPARVWVAYWIYLPLTLLATSLFAVHGLMDDD